MIGKESLRKWGLRIAGIYLGSTLLANVPLNSWAYFSYRNIAREVKDDVVRKKVVEKAEYFRERAFGLRALLNPLIDPESYRNIREIYRLNKKREG